MFPSNKIIIRAFLLNSMNSVCNRETAQQLPLLNKIASIVFMVNTKFLPPAVAQSSRGGSFPLPAARAACCASSSFHYHYAVLHIKQKTLENQGF